MGVKKLGSFSFSYCHHIALCVLSFVFSKI